MYTRRALGLAEHWNMDMLVPVEFIPFYEKVKDHDEMLLKFAKLSFKFLQLQLIPSRTQIRYKVYVNEILSHMISYQSS